MLNEYLRLSRESDELYEKWSEGRDKLDKHQAAILAEFGLPDRYPYSHYLTRLIHHSKPESAFESLMVDLYKLGKEYADREPKSNLQTLRDAKRNLQEASEVLSAIGVINSSYTRFIYDSVFLTGREDDKTCLTLLKDANSYEDLENLLYYHQHVRTISKGVDSKIPYLPEFLKQDPEDEEILELLNLQHQITEENELNTDYRSTLIKTRNVLEDAGQQLFTCLINVAMSGELSDADDFEVGDVLNFKEGDFRSLDDQNVQLIIRVLDAIGKSYASLININNLDDNPNNEDETPF